MPSETGRLKSNLYRTLIAFDRPVPYLDEVALTFPQLKIVAGHIGHPWTGTLCSF